MNDVFTREISLIGEQSFCTLQNSTVAVFGLGGVGSFVVEALARAGVKSLILVDNDVIAPHNINRQLFALHSTVGKSKAEVAKQRVLDINPEASVTVFCEFYGEQTAELIDISAADYVADCIDTVSSKILLIQRAKAAGVPVISCMGTGNKLDCSFKVADISKTQACPLAKVMRRELKERAISGVKVVYSEELPKKPLDAEAGQRKQTPASISYVPSSAGLLMAGEIIRDIIKNHQ